METVVCPSFLSSLWALAVHRSQSVKELCLGCFPFGTREVGSWGHHACVPTSLVTSTKCVNLSKLEPLLQCELNNPDITGVFKQMKQTNMEALK